VGKPSILIPLPGAANSEQYYNARILEQHNACLLIENDKLRSEFLPALKSLLRAKDRLSEMGKSAKMLAKPDAAKLIAESIIHYIS
jgi:UDP-N-acetylglucosamine--N-acetylmuramyl-(pentapeptide) pyrophosphoryl-undecaprenol N-acetylglucosamine transferase